MLFGYYTRFYVFKYNKENVAAQIIKEMRVPISLFLYIKLTPSSVY